MRFVPAASEVVNFLCCVQREPDLGHNMQGLALSRSISVPPYLLH